MAPERDEGGTNLASEIADAFEGQDRPIEFQGDEAARKKLEEVVRTAEAAESSLDPNVDAAIRITRTLLRENE